MGLELKPLQPLEYGNVLIVGAKASNFEDDLKSHPRVTIWSSQEEHWTSKDLPQNVRAVFITKWIGHTTFGKIHSEARRRHITIFNPEGTGIIARQVRELLNMNTTPTTPVDTPPVVVNTVRSKPGFQKKLHVLVRYIDFNKRNVDNAHALMNHARELGITTTIGSLSVFVANERQKLSHQVQTNKVKVKTKAKLDVSVEILDNVVKEINDMRDYLIAVTKENQMLRDKLDKLKKWFDE